MIRLKTKTVMCNNRTNVHKTDSGVELYYIHRKLDLVSQASREGLADPDGPTLVSDN